MINDTCCFWVLPFSPFSLFLLSSALSYVHFCYVPGPVSRTLIFSSNLPNTYHKMALNNLVFLKRKRMYQPECIWSCPYRMPCMELQGSCSFWHLGVWADRSIIFMCSHEYSGNGNKIWLSSLPPRDDILLRFHWSCPVLWSQQSSKCWSEHETLSSAEKTQKYVGRQYDLLHWGTEMLSQLAQ